MKINQYYCYSRFNKHQQNKMNTLVVFFACAFVAATQGAELSEQQVKILKQNFKTCSESSQVDKAVIIEAKNGNIADNNNQLDNFLNCIFKLSGLINDEGKLQFDVIREKIPAEVSKENVDKIFKTCAKVENEPKEKVARAAYKCFLNASASKIQLIQGGDF